MRDEEKNDYIKELYSYSDKIKDYACYGSDKYSNYLNEILKNKLDKGESKEERLRRERKDKLDKILK